ncbi:hypothetical protein DUNSADRAFT_15388 [Dunaliella salina]|uniref:K Homology domain-containing protein n=1 Tax=Dunaliella salina TaxID=3046 RepID=A0ABQ7H1W7_DUNSA|nr:hypothetical protein DUNSADRAFT_15388 [Dunaliella salina]|eukprot:KAF5840846.1 hypothetical protein DUNSADRAFT_15388 [Dunaliella salina]
MNKRREALAAAQACITNDKESARPPVPADGHGKDAEGEGYKQVLVMDTERVQHLIGKDGQHIGCIRKLARAKLEVLQAQEQQDISELHILATTPRDLALAVRLCCSAMHKGFIHLNAAFLKGLDLPAVQSRWNVGLKVAGPVDPHFPQDRLLVILYIPGRPGLLSSEDAGKVEAASGFLRGLQKQSAKQQPKRDSSPARPALRKQAPARQAPGPQPLGAPLRKQAPSRHDRDWMRNQKGARAHLQTTSSWSAEDKSRAAKKNAGRWCAETEEDL